MPNNRGGTLLDLTQLQLAVGLIHALPEARATLVGRDHRLVEVGRQPGADLTPCHLRNLVLADLQAGPAERSLCVESIDVRGGLEPLGAGLSRRRVGNGEERWFATLLSPDEVRDAVAELELDGTDDAVSAWLRPDLCLGVTAVGLAAADAAHTGLLDEAATALLAACLVGELIRDARRSDV
jgi:hypothetical protein